MGLSEGHMAWLLGLTRPQYRELEGGRLHITNDLYERIRGLRMAPRDKRLGDLEGSESQSSTS
jgi:hypothetical protein